MNPLVELRSGGAPPADAAMSFVARLSFSGANSTEMLGYLARRPDTISPPTSLSNGNMRVPPDGQLGADRRRRAWRSIAALARDGGEGQ